MRDHNDQEQLGGSRVSSPKLLGVQYLRAAAALMVAYFHLLLQVPQFPYLSTHGIFDTQRLQSGVDIFFVISGFIMLVSSRNSEPSDFAIRRLIRIVPLYWLLTLVLAAMMLVHSEWFRTTVLSREFLLKSLLFIPYPNPNHIGSMEPLLVPGWTLNLEMFFYAIFTAVLFVPLRYRLAITAVVLVMTVSIRYLLPNPASHPVAIFYSDPQILEFWRA